jgi:hypothetical protein
VWLLRGGGPEPLRVPMAADGAEALLDAFAALPGFDAGRADRALAAEIETLVWRRATPAADVPRLADGRRRDGNDPLAPPPTRP